MKFLKIMLLAACAGFAQTPPSTGAQLQMLGWLTAAQTHTNVQAGPVIGKPFSGTEIRRETSTLADGTKTATSATTAIYRDAEGRMRMESGRTVVIYDPPANVWYNLNSDKKTFKKTEVRDGTSSMQFMIAGNQSNTNAQMGGPPHRGVQEDLGSQVINGISTKGARITLHPVSPFIKSDADSNINVVNENWYSDALGILMKSSNNDPRFGIVTYELTNLNLSTPDPALFKVPSDYQEVQQMNQLLKPPAKQ